MQKTYPFKFLESYQREDKEFFFGRDEEIAALYKMIFETRILLIYGTSGTGKTSLIQCGLANKFESYDWSSLYIRWNGDILHSLDKILCEKSKGRFSPDSKNPFEITAPNEKLAAVYKTTLKPIYLIFDQFEELYVLGNKTEQTNFITAVKEILSVEQPVKIIISIREEYLGYLYELEKQVPELLRKKLRVEPMNLDKVSSVIKSIGNSPLSLVTLERGYEDQIASEIFDKLRGGEDINTIQLPYLQVFLDKLYHKVIRSVSSDEEPKIPAVFTRADIKDMENIGDVLRNFLDDQVMNISQKLSIKPETIWNILSPFVSLEGTKVPLSVPQLSDHFENKERKLNSTDLTNVIKALENGRILRFTEKEQRYEIAHDSLAKQVNAKRSDEEIAILEVQRLIKSQVAVKEEAREFFTEKQLLFIEPYLEKFKETGEEEKWIKMSRANIEEQKRQEESRKEEELTKARKRLRTVAGLLVFALLALIIAAYFGWDANNKKIKIQQTYDQLKIAEEERKKSMQQEQIAKQMRMKAEWERQKALKAAQENLMQMYQSEKNRYTGEKMLLEKNIRSYKQYGADNDVILEEKNKITQLEAKIRELDQKMKQLKK